MAENSNSHKIFHVEILRQTNSLLENNEAVMRVSNWLKLQDVIGKEFSITKFDDEFLKEHIQSITIYENAIKAVNGDFPETRYYVYNFNSFAPEIDEAEDEQQISTQWTLPTQEFNDVWDSLIYDSNVKDELLNYVETALDFSDKSVNSSIISRGTELFFYMVHLEQSGKLVTKMFHSILNLLEDPNVLVIVLLDEVETLARSRSSALSGNEPSDALRVVNAVLTHLDMIKRYPNVLILTTSNITEAIDVALIDRADIKQYIGLPSVEAIYQIYSSCIKELQQCGVICTRELLLPMRRLKTATEGHSNEPYHHEERSLKLKSIAEQSVGFSGRTLRKMPFIACALFIKTKLVSLDAFLDALSKAVERQWRDVNQLKVQA
ncbi:pachytene checkpoint protein 2 homolog [Caerostris extrusa]|uniref:Pachytene checkpoint protein 2 homolog n=1 Tax=Caerostris extrusa TaxID=172846 RepID=A0AAV4PK47_CAEEX|nr:pachytene checkpoint protein 2 homolog [Caerostris extrusa]